MQTRVSSVAASLQATPPAGGTHQAAAQVVRVVELQLVLPSCHVGGIPQVLGLKAQADVAAQASDDLQAAQVALSSTGVVLLGDNTSLDKGLVDRTGHVGGWWSAVNHDSETGAGVDAVGHDHHHRLSLWIANLNARSWTNPLWTGHVHHNLRHDVFTPKQKNGLPFEEISDCRSAFDDQ